LLALLPPAHGTEADTFSPVVSYQFFDSLATPDTPTPISSPIVSYQFFDWIGDENVTFTNSSNVSYYFDGVAAVTLPAEAGFGTGAILRGQVSPLGLTSTASFEWGTSPGALTNRTPGQDVGSSAQAVPISATLTGLKAGTIYFFRVRRDAFGKVAPQVGETLSFNTSASPPRTVPRVSVAGRGTANERTRSAAYFTFTRSGDRTLPLTVFFAPSGSAIPGVDYDSPGTQVTFPAGGAQVEVAIVPRADAIPEPAERVTVTLLNSPSYQTTGALIAHRSILDEAITGKPITLTIGSGGQARTSFAAQTLRSLDAADQWFRVNVPEPTTLNISVTGHWKATKDAESGTSGQTYEWLAAHLGVELISPRGEVLDTAEKSPVTNAGFVYFPAQGLRKQLMEPGTYYLRVYKTDEAGGGAINAAKVFNRTNISYLVSVSSGPFWELLNDSVLNGSLGFPGLSTFHNPAGEVHHVGFRAMRGSILSRTPTWVVTHGRSSSWQAFTSMATALARPAGWKAGDPVPQVLYFDWMSAAATDGVLGGVSLRNGYWFPMIGAKMADLLTAFDSGGRRFTGADLRMAGHSWGTYVNYEIAKGVKGKGGPVIEKIVALDPAANATNYPFQDVRFRDVSNYSLGFWSSQLGSKDATRTCTDAFEMEVNAGGFFPAYTRHIAVNKAFLTMLTGNDLISNVMRGVLFNGDMPLWQRQDDDEDLSLNRRLHFKAGQINDTPFSFTPDGYEGSMSVEPIKGVWRAWEMFFHPRQPQ